MARTSSLRKLGRYNSQKISDLSPCSGKGQSNTNLSLLTAATDSSSTTTANLQSPVSRALHLETFLGETNSVDNISIADSVFSLDRLGVTSTETEIPHEILIINEDAMTGEGVLDIHQRLKNSDRLLQSYRAKLESTEDLTDSLHHYLHKAKVYAEILLAEKRELLQTIQDLEQGEASDKDRNTLFKSIMFSTLLYYISGGSEVFLIGAVVLYLLYDIMDSLVVA